MKSLHLLLPQPFPPAVLWGEWASGLRLPALQTLLARALSARGPVMALEDWLCHRYGAGGVAPVRAAADGLAVTSGYWLCADPVSLHLLRAEVLLLPECDLTLQEAKELCASLTAHFAAQGLRFYAAHPQRWYVHAEEMPDVQWVPFSQALGRDVKALAPHGRDAAQWLRWQNEMQMLLHAHPLNRLREERGAALLNGLWLWGGGQMQPLARPYDWAGGDEPLAAAFARIAGLPVATDPCALQQDGRGLWVYAAPGRALQQQDVVGWRAALQAFEQELARPSLRALQRGSLRALTVELLHQSGSVAYSLTPGASRRLWRRARPLSEHAG